MILQLGFMGLPSKELVITQNPLCGKLHKSEQLRLRCRATQPVNRTERTAVTLSMINVYY